jgi:hypothetical protein
LKAFHVIAIIAWMAGRELSLNLGDDD